MAQEAQNTPSLPAAGKNNFWYSLADSDLAIVFVHGVLSDSRSCWQREEDGNNPIYWPDLLCTDKRLPPHSVYLGGYHTAVDSGAFEIRNCATQLFNALILPDAENRAAVMSKNKIVFVCHSTGGIVTRFMLCKETEAFENKTVGLVLIASPSFGSKMADKLEALIDLANHRLGSQLQWGSESLRNLDDDFSNLVHDRKIPGLRGIEAYEHHFIVHSKFWPSKKVVVEKESAGRYFGEPELLPETNHFSCVKPGDHDHPGHGLLVRFLLKHFSSDISLAPLASHAADKLPVLDQGVSAKIDQVFDAPVQQVIAINELHGVNSPAAANLPERLQLAATLFDRYPQLVKTEKIIKDRLDRKIYDRPLIFVLNGGAEDLLKAFILRLEKIHLVSGGWLDPLGSSGAYLSLGSYRWPRNPSIPSLLGTFSERLNLPGTAKKDEIENAIAEIDASIGFSHRIAAKYWTRKDRDFLERWLEYLSSDWPTVDRPRLCIGFLYVEHIANSTTKAKDIIEFIAEIGSHISCQDCVHVIGEFGDVDVTDVDDWIDDLKLYYGNDGLSEASLLASKTILFPDMSKAMPYSNIYPQLFDAILKAAPDNYQRVGI